MLIRKNGINKKYKQLKIKKLRMFFTNDLQIFSYHFFCLTIQVANQKCLSEKMALIKNISS